MVRTCSTEHLYDTSNRLTSQSYKSSTEERSEEYTYDSDDGTLSGMKTASGENLQYTYDYLKRLQSRTDGARSTAYEYQDAGDNGTSTRIRKITQTGAGENSLELEYEYDAAGNITKVIRNGQILAEYTYDALYQLINERLPQSSQEYAYSYDAAGNIRSITAEEDGAAVTKEYGYTDADWKDLLTEYEGEELTYDEMGNPLEYYNGRDWNFTWTEGRKLACVNSSGNAIATYEYDAGGLRREKTVSGTAHTFCYLGEQLVEETYGEDSLRFAYDEQGRPYSVEHNGTLYYYILNQQGDVIYIVDGSGNIQAEYVYNAWGKILEVIGTAEIGTINPLRYRGYYYDAETGFYYVSSRYYDPEVGRFISADGAISGIGGDIRGYNLYSYCMNNPVNMSDPDGNWQKWVQKIGSTVKKVVNTVVKKVKSVASSIKNTVSQAKKQPGKLPTKGEPGSSQTLNNPDGTPKRKRWYGPDGNAERDRDYNHPGKNIPFPHDHVWDNGKRIEDHLLPSPDYEFSYNPLVGATLVTVCGVGMAVVVLDDATGIGVANDFLVTPLGAGISKGVMMLMK